MQAVSSSTFQPMMQFNTRSILRPEYLNYSPSEYSSYESFYQDKYSERRINTNTAPVYSTDNPGPPRRKITQRRLTGHPYLRSTGNSQSNDLLSDLSEFSVGPEHPAFQTSASSIPVQMDVTIPENRWAQDSIKKPKSVTRSPNRFTSPPSSRQRSPGGSSNSSSPNDPSTTGSHPRSYSHGQAEQLRRSRESGTFALIDAQLSKPPLNLVRDMYLQNRVGTNASSSAPARTTKKANLSAVHTVVRFRIKEYLVSMMTHTRRMLDLFFSSTRPNYNSGTRDVLASQLFGHTQLPCSPSCDFCKSFRCQLDRQMPSQKMVYSKSLVPQSKPCLMPIDKSYSTSCLNPSEFETRILSPESVRQYTLSPVVLKPEASSTTTPLSSPSSPQLNFDILDQNSDLLEEIQDEKISSSSEPPHLDDIPLHECRRSPSRIRLDSVSARLQEAFDVDTMFWSANNIDFGVGEDPADLQNIILGNNSDIKFEPFSDDNTSLSAIYDLDALNKIPLIEYAHLDSDVSIKREADSSPSTSTQSNSCHLSSNCSQHPY